MDQYIGRIVVLLTPVIAGVSGWLVTQASDILPGNPQLDEAELTALFVSGVLAAGAVIYKWLEGRGKYEVAQVQAGNGDPHVPVGLKDE